MATIYTFWEPREAVIPYLALCMETWKVVFRDHDIELLDYATLHRHIDPADLDVETLRRLPPSMQKDAVMVAVLHRFGGVFMDIDTLAVRDIAPILARLKRSEMVMFHSHLAFIAARPGARLLSGWLSAIRRRLATLRSERTPPQVPWDYLGNQLLDTAMDDVIDSQDHALLRMLGMGWVIAFARARIPPDGQNRVLRRLVKSVLWRRRRLLFKTFYAGYLKTLDRNRYAFMPEVLDARGHELPYVDRYRRYWFEANEGGESALRAGQVVIGLHNHAVPDWYKALSATEVLAHPCRLSRTLKTLLNR